MTEEVEIGSEYFSLVKNEPNCLEYAPKHLKRNFEFIKKCTKINHECLGHYRYLKSIENDKDFFNEMIEDSPAIMMWASKKLKLDRELVIKSLIYGKK